MGPWDKALWCDALACILVPPRHTVPNLSSFISVAISSTCTNKPASASIKRLRKVAWLSRSGCLPVAMWRNANHGIVGRNFQLVAGESTCASRTPKWPAGSLGGELWSRVRRTGPSACSAISGKFEDAKSDRLLDQFVAPCKRWAAFDSCASHFRIMWPHSINGAQIFSANR